MSTDAVSSEVSRGTSKAVPLTAGERGDRPYLQAIAAQSASARRGANGSDPAGMPLSLAWRLLWRLALDSWPPRHQP